MDLSCNLGDPNWQQVYGRDGGVAFVRQQDQDTTLHVVPPCTCTRCAEQWVSWYDQTGFETPEETLEAQKRGVQIPNPHIRGYSRVLDNYQATELLADKLSSINGDRRYLTSAFQQHGNSILSRWKKKRVTGRREVLTPFFPTIAHRGWLRERMMGNTITIADYEKFKEFALQPALSMDELAQDFQSLILLVHARTVWTPEQWVAVDRSSTAWGWWDLEHPIFFNPASVCLSGPSFGQLVPLNLSSNHEWKTSGFPRAMMILEAQAHLLRLLSSIVERLLEESVNGLGNDRWLQSVSQARCRSKFFETSFPLLHQLYFEPPQQDPARMTQIAKVRLDASSDTIWLMQTEAAYFNRWLSMRRPSVKSHLSALCQTGLKGEYEEQMSHIAMLFQRTARWEDLHQRCVALRDGFQKVRGTEYDPSISLKTLQKDVQDLDDVLVREMHDHMMLCCGAAAILFPNVTRTTREYRGNKIPTLYCRLPENFIKPIDLYPESDEAVFAKESPIVFALNTMFPFMRAGERFPPEIFESSYQRAVCLLERSLTSTNGNQTDYRANFDFVNIVADMAALYSIRVCLRMHTSGVLPDSKMWSPDDVGERSSWNPITAVPKHKGNQLARQLRHFRALPVPGFKQDYEWLARNDARVKALRIFWTSFEDAFWCSSDQTCPVTIRAKTLLGAHREQAHIANTEIERQAVVDRLQKEHQDRLGITPMQTQWGDEPPSARTIESKRPKKKRTVRSSKDQDQIANDETLNKPVDNLSLAEQKLQDPPIEVPRESLLTLQRLFTSNADDTRGPVHWQSFKKAMADAGFLVAHRGGSAVEFAKEDQGRISVHRPHPEDKLDNIMLLSIGKRTNRHFGWTRETFVERSKAASSDRGAALTVLES